MAPSARGSVPAQEPRIQIHPSVSNLDAVVLREFGLHYLADELPTQLHEVLADFAASSAVRLRRHVPEPDIPALAALLRALSVDPQHPTVRAIEEETSIERTEHPEQWAELSQLLGWMTAGLDPAPAVAQHRPGHGG